MNINANKINENNRTCYYLKKYQITKQTLKVSRASLFERDNDSQIFDVIKSENDTTVKKIREFLWESPSLDIIAPVLTPLINSFLSVAHWRFFILDTVLLIGDWEKIEQNQGG